MSSKKPSSLLKALNYIEIIGNKLPDPCTIFIILSIIVIIASEIAFRLGISVEYIGFKDGVETTITSSAKSLLSAEGIRIIVTKALPNYIGFAPLGVVMLAMLGVGISEKSGLIGVALKLLVLKTPKRLITAVVVFAGIMSNVASDIGYVILIPLGAIVFLIMGRHPLAGLAATFAGVSAGYSANLTVGVVDVLLANFTTSAANIIDPNYHVAGTSNFYFLAFSTILLTIVGTIVTEKIVEPNLGKYEGEGSDKYEHDLNISELDKKGLMMALLSFIIFAIIICILVVPSNGILRGENGAFLKSPFMDGIVIIIALFFFIPSVVYAFVTKQFKNDKDVMKSMGESMSTLGYYLVLSFFASQFVYYFSYTNIGTIISVTGANLLKSTGFTGVPLIISFVFASAFINLFIGSASAKWAIMSPIFVPMFMQIGYSPEFVQLAYRIGDSSTNIITPLMSYFAMIVVFAEKYESKEQKEGSGLGTLAALMLPYSITFLVSWSLLLIIWMLTGLPIGIGGVIHY
ncbi:AbgT family transporter [Brachyspira alvinipulli]|uniref:AbgT family transporter n=1 Tax=Brachyspira alvinipulli TaxID=84379 RepID=UPI0030063544